MISLLTDCPGESRFDLRFGIAGVPVRVHPWFWLTCLFFCFGNELGAGIIWIAVCFVSILIHELGHAFAMRAFGDRPEVALHALGGMAIPRRVVAGTARQVLISAAGPLSGLAFGAAAAWAATALGARVPFFFASFGLPVWAAVFPDPGAAAAGAWGRFYRGVVFNDLLLVNLYWSLVNLLPIDPLDGGSIARRLLVAHDPIGGRRRALIVSAVFAGAVAVLGLIAREMYVMVFFALLAVASAQKAAAMAAPRHAGFR